jgi:hypothetical protein
MKKEESDKQEAKKGVQRVVKRMRSANEIVKKRNWKSRHMKRRSIL